MKNIVVCFGCDKYEQLPKLTGAEADADRVFDLLTTSGLYDAKHSMLLRSSTLQEARECLNDLAAQVGLGVVTFYFAGHGGIKAGTFYLCFRDADQTRLSTTALPILDLFTVIGEIQPRQVNLIVDACQSAGSMFDLSALMKPEVIGRSGSSSIAFLAASASDQYASETASGGIATTALVGYLTGQRKIQQTRPYLDLVEVGLGVSRDVLDQSPDQSPVAWGLNLYGDGMFAVNPHYGSASVGPTFSVDGIPPASAAGRVVRQHTEALWQEYRLILSDHSPNRLRTTVTLMRAELGEEFPTFIQGYASALSTRANSSEDLLAASDALAVCAITLLPDIEHQGAARACRELLLQRAKLDRDTILALRTFMIADKYYLLSGKHSLADLHYLPIRISRLLAWLGLSAYADVTLGIDDSTTTENRNVIVDMIFHQYGESIVSVSDEQAAWTFAFGILSERFGWMSKAHVLVERLFVSAVAVGGSILRPGASGTDALNYSLTRAGMSGLISHDDLANPSELLSVLFLLGHDFGFSNDWDKALVAMDGITLNAYVPPTYRRFGEAVIAGGNNHTYRLGHGIWRIEEYASAFVRGVAPHIRSAGRDLDSTSVLLCGLAACIFPNRVPYLLNSQYC